MKIYVAHASSFDYIKQLYEPLKNSKLGKEHQFIFPHEKNSEPTHSKANILSCDVFFAEVSYPSTGLGIELAWASDAGCKILCFAKQDSKPSSSINLLGSNIFRYSDQDELIDCLDQAIKKMKIPS